MKTKFVKDKTKIIVKENEETTSKIDNSKSYKKLREELNNFIDESVDIDEVNTQISTQTSDISTLASNNKTRLDTLSATVANHTTSISNLGAQQNTLSGSVSTLQTQVSQNSSSINTITGTTIPALQNSISTNASNIQQNASDISSLQTTVGGHTTTLNTLTNTTIPNMQTAIATNTHDIEFDHMNIMYNVEDIADLRQRVCDLESADVEASDIDSGNATSGQVLTADGQGGASWANGGGGLSSVTASNINSQSATQGQVLSADGNGGASWTNASGGYDYSTQIATIESDIYKINQTIEKIKNYVGYEDIVYDQEIHNDFDTYERELEIEGINLVVSPNVFFANEQHLTSTDEEENVTEYPNPINSKTEITVVVDTAGDYTFTLYENSTIAKTVTKTFENADVNQEKTITIKATMYNPTEEHNYYVKVQAVDTSSSKTITIKKLKMKITAPNATILNKIHPFDVQFNYYTNKYYLSDCSSGYAKLAEIDANNLTQTSDIVWTQTNIEAQNYKTFFIGATDNTTTTLGKKYALITHKNNTATLVDLDTNTTIYTAPVGTHNVSPIYTKHNYSQFYTSTANENTITAKLNSIYQDGTTKSSTGLPYQTTVARINCMTSNTPYLSYSASWASCLAVKTNSVLQGYIVSNICNTYNIDFVQDAKKYMNRMSNGVYYTDCYYKRFGKYYYFLCYDVGTTQTIQGNIQELGEFDDLFVGKNNNTYFVVQNNQLQYLTSLE